MPRPQSRLTASPRHVGCDEGGPQISVTSGSTGLRVGLVGPVTNHMVKGGFGSGLLLSRERRRGESLSPVLMAESDGGEAASPSPGPRDGGRATSDPRPQLTKSRSISGSAAASFAAADRARRGGAGGGRDSMLVRRSSTAPLPPAASEQEPRRLTVAVDDPSYAAPNGGVLDRDWCYPSFLGPHASRPRPPRQQQQHNTTSAGRRSTNSTLPPRVAVSQREEEKSLASVVKRTSLLEERRPLPPPPPPPRSPRFDLSPYLPLVSQASCSIYVP
jgi:ion channel POLLUX/CASTOR